MSDLAAMVAKLVVPSSIVTPRKLKRGEALSPIATKFGGIPYMEQGDEWTACGGCDEPLSFIFQCNLAECPHSSSRGLFTFFYCHSCSSWGDIPPDVENAWIVHRYDSPDASKAAKIDDQTSEDVRLNKCACDLVVAKSLPDWEGVNDLGPAIAKLSAKQNKEEPWAAYQAAAIELLGSESDMRTQISGYPMWVQGAEPIECEECGEFMRLLAQIDSEEKAGLMWGDSGMVYLFECPEHPSAVQMRLQCF